MQGDGEDYLRGGAQVHEAILRVQLRDRQLGRQRLGRRRVEDLVEVRGQRARGSHLGIFSRFSLDPRKVCFCQDRATFWLKY